MYFFSDENGEYRAIHLVIVVNFASYTFGSSGTVVNEVVANFTINGVNQGHASYGSTSSSFQAINWNPSYQLQFFSPVPSGSTSYVWGGTVYLFAIYGEVGDAKASRGHCVASCLSIGP